MIRSSLFDFIECLLLSGNAEVISVDEAVC